jgi:hypothetical protein
MMGDVTLLGDAVLVGDQRFSLPHPADDAFLVDDLFVVPNGYLCEPWLRKAQDPKLNRRVVELIDFLHVLEFD